MRNMYLDELEKLHEQLNEMMKVEHPDLDELLKISVELDEHIDQLIKEPNRKSG